MTSVTSAPIAPWIIGVVEMADSLTDVTKFEGAVFASILAGLILLLVFRPVSRRFVRRLCSLPSAIGNRMADLMEWADGRDAAAEARRQERRLHRRIDAAEIGTLRDWVLVVAEADGPPVAVESIDEGLADDPNEGTVVWREVRVVHRNGGDRRLVVFATGNAYWYGKNRGWPGIYKADTPDPMPDPRWVVTSPRRTAGIPKVLNEWAAAECREWLKNRPPDVLERTAP